jgi:hypothetical protein
MSIITLAKEVQLDRGIVEHNNKTWKTSHHPHTTFHNLTPALSTLPIVIELDFIIPCHSPPSFDHAARKSSGISLTAFCDHLMKKD